ncbi:hypothetical protein MTR67_028216 [Solanum verrucosum]|uniref:Uncharacterized protein n=1 Tax=Solanum verrucosum TaxID=315347 RepID=A0AAF0R3Q0_SOLVR|nr:hypothetical protein MTR67_028216 [Solanum verrucosum]
MALISSLCVFVLVAHFATPIVCHKRLHQAALFVFGDSIFDPGNNKYINPNTSSQGVNNFPYGESFFKYPTGRASDGRLIPDFIAEYANLPLIPPYFEIGKEHFIHGVNFASGGSGCLAFTANNDFLFPLLANLTSPYSDTEYLHMVMGNLTSVLKGVYKEGGRKFVMFNLGPLGCIPSIRALNLQKGVTNGSCMDEATNKAKMFNLALPRMFKQLEEQLPGFKYTIFNFSKVLADSINNPTKYAHFATRIVCHERPHQAALFVFGDSIFDPGNNNYINTTASFQANYLPYGESFFKYPTGRTSNGRLIPDFIAEYANLPLIPPYFQIGKKHFDHGVNFASAGSGCLVETARGFVIDLQTQLKYFQNVVQLLKKKVGKTETKQILSSAVYIFSTGSNEVFAPLSANSTFPYSDTEYLQMIMGNLTTVLKGVYKEGGRKFVMLNLGPLGCVPSVRALNLQKGVTNGSCMEEVTNIAKMFNSALPKMLKHLEKQLPGFKYTIFNTFKVLAESIDNPTKFGFKISETACCGTGPFRGIFSCGGKRQVLRYKRWLVVGQVHFEGFLVVEGRGRLKEYELYNNVKDYLFFDSVHPTSWPTRNTANYYGMELQM